MLIPVPLYESHLGFTIFLQGINFSFPEEDLTKDCYNNRTSCRTDNLEQEVEHKTKQTLYVSQVEHFLGSFLELWKFCSLWTDLPEQFEEMALDGEL